MKKHLLLVLEAMLSIVLSIAIIVCALYAAEEVFDSYKGRNYSDVGIPMYTNSVGAAILAFGIYFLMIVAVPIIVWKIKRWKIFLYIYCVVNFLQLIPLFFIFRMLIA